MWYNKWKKYSYTAQREQKKRLLWIVEWLIIIFITYSVITNLCIFSIQLKTNTMEPTLLPGDRCFVYSITLLTKDSSSPMFPLERGDLVVIEKKFNTHPISLWKRIGSSFIQFFTAQQFDILNDSRRQFVKRIIAMPGDKVEITNYVVKVKPAGEQYTLTEFELTRHPYDIVVPDAASMWDERLPFSGTMSPITLKSDEYFVLSDTRTDVNDSRTWGPCTISEIKGKPFFRYWPFGRMEKL
jgi:signal peptidase I